MGKIEDSLRSLARLIATYHYYVEKPQELKAFFIFLIITNFVFLNMFPKAFYKSANITLMVISSIIVFLTGCVFVIEFEPRAFTAKLRKILFFLIYFLPTQNIDEDPALQIQLRKDRKFKKPASRTGVVITGVTGFVGVHLLLHIFQNTERKIFCFIRKCETRKAAFKKLMKSIEKYEIPLKLEELDCDRLVFIGANFKHKKLGITQANWNLMAKEVDIIIHNAASLTYSIPFEVLRDPWIDNLIVLSEFCYQKEIQIHVCGSILQQPVTKHSNERSFWRCGYSRINLLKSKLMAHFFKQGLEGCFYEIGFVAGASHDKSGLCQIENPVVLFCILLLETHILWPCFSGVLYVDSLVKLVWERSLNRKKYKNINHIHSYTRSSPQAMRESFPNHFKEFISDQEKLLKRYGELGWNKTKLRGLFPHPFTKQLESDVKKLPQELQNLIHVDIGPLFQKTFNYTRKRWIRALKNQNSIIF